MRALDLLVRGAIAVRAWIRADRTSCQGNGKRGRTACQLHGSGRLVDFLSCRGDGGDLEYCLGYIMEVRLGPRDGYLIVGDKKIPRSTP